MKKHLNRALSLFLSFVMTLLLIPTGAFAQEISDNLAEADTLASGPTVYVRDTNEARSANVFTTLQAASDALKGTGGTIIIQKDFHYLESPWIISDGQSYTIQADRQATILPAPNGKWTAGATSDLKPYNTMIGISGGSNVTFHGNNLTISGRDLCQVIAASEGSQLAISGCKIQNGHVTQSRSGAGISILNGTLLVGGGAEFIENKGELGSGTGGGAIYMTGSTVALNEVTFKGNQAHSGGALYNYDSVLTCTSQTRFGTGGDRNEANQRGGAIHNHGLTLLNGTEIMGQHSEQYGGAVYVSAGGGSTVVGKLVLNNTAITGNTASNSGAGIFIADGGELYVGGINSSDGTDSGALTVTGNELADKEGNRFLDKDGNPLASNVYAGTSGCKVIVYTNLTGPDGSIGVSTANPYDEKPLVFSVDGEHSLHGVNVGGMVQIPNSFEMSKVAANYKKLVYDGELWVLDKTKDDPNDMWLKYNPEITGGPELIFNYNLPGNDSKLVNKDIVVGQEYPLPAVNVNQPSSDVTFIFKGWSEQSQGGELKQPGTMITVPAETKTYYAQWDLKADPGPAPGPVQGDMKLVYFDKNYDGGGLTSSYVTAGTFSFTITYHVVYEDPDADPPEGDETMTVEVTFPFGFPGDPYRIGYSFDGWYTAATGGTKVSKSWMPSEKVTSLYAHWTPYSYLLTWNSNGGSGGTATTNQKQDETVKPPATPPTRNGYEFTGWYLDKNCTVPLTSGTVVSGPLTFYAGWQAKEYEISWSANYTGGAMTTTQQRHNEKLVLPPTPVQEGYTFDGWFTSATGGAQVSSSTTVTGDATYYAHWTVSVYTITWDKNTGDTGGGTTRVSHGSVIDPPTTSPTKTGYTFTGWYLDKACTTPFVNGAIATKNVTFYAGWSPTEHTITWDADYTGGGVANVTQYYDEELNIMPAPTREGFMFGGWYTGKNGSGTRAEAYGTVVGDVTFYANWVRQAQSYTVTVEWDDHSNNDLVRPESIRVQLMANDIPTGMTYLFTAADADDTGNIWSHTFEGLPVTDAVSNPITYSVAITSPVSSEYSYGIENKSATLGYILMTHKLIETDINSYVVWNDAANNDGYRPSTVTLQLYANGVIIDDAEARLAISGGGDTWTYSFKGFQKYYTTQAGVKGQEIVYTLVATPTNPGELDKYGIEYHDYTVILTHAKDTISRTVNVEWQDSNNQDGKRPASMVVQLYADNVPVQGKHVTLSSANKWTYTWNDLPRLTAGGRKVVYSAQVTSTLVDYVAKSTEMDVEMTYVPSSTSISAFVMWTDENNADGLRPDFVTAELVADGKPTGDTQVLAAVNGWTTAWKNYPIYKDGNRIEYTFRISPMPDGYRADYNGVYDTSGLSATLTHDRQLQNLTANVVWNDRGNVSGDRMETVCVQLYADGVAQDGTQVWVTEADGWQHSYKDLPIYRNGGELIRYSVYLYSSAGKYQAATEGMTLTLNLDVERVDIPLKVIWNDNDNANGLRPLYVGVILLVDDEVSKYQLTATGENGWAVTFKGMVAYGYKPDGSGGAFKYTARVIVPTGYEVEYIADTAVLSMAASTADYAATVIWNDNDDQYGARPDSLSLYLWADYRDGNGAAQTGKSVAATAADGWTATFTGLPVYRDGKSIIYSIRVADHAGYIPAYDGMTVTMTHKDTPSESGKTDFPVTLVWTDNKNANGSRPASVDVTLFANGEELQTYTATENDVSGTYTWGHTFTGLPTYQGGVKVKYTVDVAAVPNYTVRVQGNSIIFTHVQDISIKLHWDDNGNVDGSRPAAINLNLYADNREIGVSKSVAGTGNIWSCVFERVPVWSTLNTTKAAVYTWLPDAEEIAALESGGYSMDYHNYELVGTPAAYRVDLSRNVEVADYTAAINWSDDTDRDGLRPSKLTVKLYADNGDGKGAVDTGKTGIIEGGNEDAAWRYTFSSLPMWANQGKRVVYTLRCDAPTGYEAEHSDDAPTLSLTHIPKKVEVIANVIWDDATNAGGLTRFGLTAELLVDGSPNRELGDLNQDNSYTQSWGQKYVYHDHGKAYQYSFHFAAASLPADYELSVDGCTATVRRVRFNIGGVVLDKLGAPVSGAAVTLYDADKLAVANTTSGSDGRYSFGGLAADSYTVRATKNMNGKTVGTADISITNTDLNNMDIRLMPDAGGGEEDYTYTLSGTIRDSNGLPAAWAMVSVFAVNKEPEWYAIADATGYYRVPALPNGTYQIAVVCSINGVDYTASGQAVTIFNADKTAPDIIVKVPAPEQPADKPCVVSGKVTNELDKAMADILIVVYGPNETRYTAVVSDDMGEYKLTGVPNGKYKLHYYYAGTAVVTTEVIINGEADMTVPTVIIDTTAQSGLGTLVGVAVDAQGKPVEGAEVYVYTKDGEQVGYQKTGKSGAYRFDLPVGEYVVEIRKPLDNVTDTEINVGDGETEGGSVTADTFTIAGTVMDEEGKPVEGVTVYLYGEESAATFSILDALYYTGYITEPPILRQMRELTGKAEPEAPEPPIMATPPEQEPTETPPTIEEDVVEQGGENAQAPSTDGKGAFVRLMETTTDADGNYEFNELVAGEYVVKIAHGVGGNGGSTDYPVTAGPNATPPEDSNITVTTESYTVSGMVKDKDGKPVEGAVVTITDDHGNEVGEHVTGADGIYVFPGLSNCVYHLNISYPDFEELGGGNVNIEEGGTVVFQGYAVSGTVKDDKGNAIKGAVVILTNSETAAEYITATGQDGTFRTAVPNGSYSIKATYDGKETTGTVKVNNADVTGLALTIKLSTSGGDGPSGSGDGPSGGGDNPSGGGSSGGGSSGGGSSGGNSQGQQVKAYIYGYGDGTFKPGNNIARSEVAAILSRVAQGFDPKGNYPTSYTDVAGNAWYQANVGFCLAKGLMNGRGEGAFAPDAAITRAEFAAVVARLLGLPNTVGKASFPDTTGTWAEGYISQLADKGAITGLPSGNFAPDALITRAEAVTIVNRALSRTPDKDALTLLVQSGKAGFSDVAAPHWAYLQIIEASVDHTHK